MRLPGGCSEAAKTCGFMESMVNYPESELADAGTRPPPRAPSLPLHRSSSGLTGGSLPTWAALVDAARGLAECEQIRGFGSTARDLNPILRSSQVKPEDDDGGEARAVSTRRRVSEPFVCDADTRPSLVARATGIAPDDPALSRVREHRARGAPAFSRSRRDAPAPAARTPAWAHPHKGSASGGAR